MRAHRGVADPLLDDGMLSDGSDNDPMSSMANLADIMLVFACGLMLALIAYWNIDMPSIVEITQTDMTRFVEDPDEDQATVSAGEGFEDMGRVYRDPQTGQMYILEEEDATQGAEGSVE